MDNWNFVVALAGNPNTGKSTVFNALTGSVSTPGTGPGRPSRGRGGFEYRGHRFKLVDLPGPTRFWPPAQTRSRARFPALRSADVTLVVMDATRVERNLNLVLQVLEITDRSWSA